MLIIAEGPDGSGKSTLCELLEELLPLGTVRYHATSPKPEQHPLDLYENPLEWYRPCVGQHVVCDRWHVGEYIYPRVMDRVTKLEDVTRWHIERYLESRGALTVYCTNDPDELVRRATSRGEDFVNEEQLREVAHLYNEWWDTSADPSGYVPVMNPTKHTAELVLAVAGRIESSVAHLVPHQSYIGPRRPSLLLIGERREFLDSPTRPPAFRPYPSESGHWLLTTLLEDQVLLPPTSYGLANAYEEDLQRLWSSLGMPRTVALGRLADEELSAAHVPHGSIPHPQYARRFHHRERQWYRELLIRAAYNREELVSCRP
jgi:thymidylate kinase